MEELIHNYKNSNVILFIGAGVSQNLGLPSWSSLIDNIATELGFNPEVYQTYGDFLSLAEYYILKKGSIGKLRSWMDREWHNIDKSKLASSKIHEYIAKGKFPLIYTTNYDNWLEEAHQLYDIKYNKIVNVSDLTNTHQPTKEIIKFHGDFSEDDSIVLSESSYFERLKFESPLDIKLRSDILSKSVLFIGYSLSDTNIRQLFYKLTNLWNRHHSPSIRPKSYIFSSKNNPIQEEILRNWGIETLSNDIDSPGEALEMFLKELTSS
jgi:NAD-dependent SIR2 family protein deacetylase